MKQFIAVITAMLLSLPTAQAQEQQTDYGLFKQLGAGVSIGTDGIGLEVATPVNSFLSLRLGYSFMPSFKYNGNFDFDSSEGFLRKEDGSGFYDNVDVEGKLHMGDLRLLLDYYPLTNSSFRITAGAYLGKSKLVTARTKNHFIYEPYWGNSGPELGSGTNTYTVVSDPKGAINADLKTNALKPYIGIGFGRAVPRNRLGVSFDLGLQFWGKPSLWTNIDDNVGTKYRKVEKSRILSKQEWCDDLKDGLDIMEKIIVYPVLSVRLNGRLF